MCIINITLRDSWGNVMPGGFYTDSLAQLPGKIKSRLAGHVVPEWDSFNSTFDGASISAHMTAIRPFSGLVDIYTLPDPDRAYVAGPVASGCDLYKVISLKNNIQVQGGTAAFSILSGGGGIQKAFLLAVSLFVSAMLMVWIHKTPAIYRQRLFGQFILLSGALGNLLDRAQYGYVIDFIDVHYENYYWPVFNVADSLIFIGVILLLFERRKPFL